MLFTTICANPVERIFIQIVAVAVVAVVHLLLNIVYTMGHVLSAIYLLYYRIPVNNETYYWRNRKPIIIINHGCREPPKFTQNVAFPLHTDRRTHFYFYLCVSVCHSFVRAIGNWLFCPRFEYGALLFRIFFLLLPSSPFTASIFLS